MRSRFTAFAVGDVDYLIRSWHPDTRPAQLDLDDSLIWYRLDIESVSAGTPFDSVGRVSFVAYHRGPGGRGELREFSRFVKVDGEWLYVDGDVG